MKTLDFNSKLAIAKTHVSGDSFRPVLGAVLHDTYTESDAYRLHIQEEA